MDTTLQDAQKTTTPRLEKAASVLDSNLLAYYPGLSADDRQFIKNSMRWAESCADLRHDQEQDPAQWFEFYSGVLWSVGWSLEHQPVIVVDNDFTGRLMDAWSKALSTQVSRAKLSLMKETFTLLENNPAALQLLTSSASQSGDFRFLPAEYNRYGELEIVLTNVRLLGSNWGSSFLFWEVANPQSQLDVRVRRFAINRRGINTYREPLQEAVKEMRLREIELTMQ
ncbi:hypothetical protein [Pseudomonas sp. NFX224]|uniref:hypothetical protein n=1 Tax=Pseudomonas sp. NFX224 TaxID=3402862 RepID=UPI003AFA16C6